MPINSVPILKKMVRLSLAFLILVFGLLFWSCNLNQNSNVEQRASFDKIFDSIQTYDSALIVFKTEDGKLIDTVFHGRILSRAGFENLPVNNWDGGKAVIFITAYKTGETVYKVEKHFDGATDKTDTTFVIIVPETGIASGIREIRMTYGDSIPLPVLTITPANLSDKTVLWSSNHPEYVLVGANYLKAMKGGSAQVTAKLKADDTKSVVFNITVELTAKIPESIALSVDTLYLATGGAPGYLTVKATPSGASNSVSWIIDDITYATATSDGSISGLKKGVTKLRAVSKEAPAVFATAWLVVSDPVAVEKVHFLKDSTNLFIGGAAESLTVEILPPKSNPAVEFAVVDQAILSLKDGRISGVMEGLTTIIVKSKENPSLTDTLKVKVLPSQHIGKVSLTPHSLKLFTGGESITLSAAVSPTTVPQKIQWYSTNTEIAKVDQAGKVSPVSPGNIKVYAISIADSASKDSADITVKRDTPVVSIGQDTIISVGQTITFLPVVAPQEYGLVTQFKWDLDGNLGWDDSSTAVKSVSYKFDQERQYAVRFYVMDSEGNETIVTQKVTVIFDAKQLALKNARLQELKIDGVAQILVPNQKVPGIFERPYSISKLEIEATTIELGAKISIDTIEVTNSGKWTTYLPIGFNEIQITVTAPNGIDVIHYFVSTLRDRSYLLTQLVPTVGILKPNFSATVQSYSMIYSANATTPIQWQVASEDTSRPIIPVFNSRQGNRILSGGFSLDYIPKIGIDTVTFQVCDGVTPVKSYQVNTCRQGWKLIQSKNFKFDAVSSSIDITTDGTNVYVGMVDNYLGGKATTWNVSDSVISIFGSEGYTPKISEIALAVHLEKLITAYKLPPQTGSNTSHVSFLVQNGKSWSAHSELPLLPVSLI